MKKILLIVTATLLLSSCITAKKRAKICSECSSVVSDSVNTVIKTEYRDTTIYLTIPGNDVIIDNPCDTNGLKAFLFERSDNGVKVTVSSNGRVLTARCDVDSLKVVIQKLNRDLILTRSHNQVEKIKELCEKEHSTRWDGFTFWLVWLLLAYIGIREGLKFLPRFLKS